MFPRSRLVIIDTDFDQERLSPGHVYFLNTQKLGISSLLTKDGNKREWTIWRTIENTAKAILLALSSLSMKRIAAWG